jgi:hypothetical protein
MTTNIDLDELASREEIRDLVNSYCLAVDRQDWASHKTLFTDDVCLELNDRDDAPPPGPENLVQYVMKYRKAGEVMSHHASNGRISIESPELAKGVWELFYVTRGNEPRIWFGFYEHDYRRVNGEWRIARLNRINSFSAVIKIEDSFVSTPILPV